MEDITEERPAWSWCQSHNQATEEKNNSSCNGCGQKKRSLIQLHVKIIAAMVLFNVMSSTGHDDTPLNEIFFSEQSDGPKAKKQVSLRYNGHTRHQILLKVVKRNLCTYPKPSSRL
jgi:hypothetical protein